MISLLRLLAAATTIGLVTTISNPLFLKIMTVFGLAHYLQAFFGSREKYQQVFLSSFKRHLGLGLTMIAILVFSLGIGIFAPDVGMRWLFGAHFVFSEVFLFKVIQSQSGKELFHATRLYRFAFSAYLYLAYIYLFLVQSPLIYAAVIVGGITLWLVLAVEIHKISGGKWRREEIDLFLFETIGLVIIPLAKHSYMGYSAVIFYHFVIWWFIPFQMKGPSAWKHLVAQFILAGILFFGFLPQLGYLFPPFSVHQTWLIILGYFHIITFFFISKWNPKFILNFNERFLWPQKKS
jgi:hypothetical protein